MGFGVPRWFWEVLDSWSDLELCEEVGEFQGGVASRGKSNGILRNTGVPVVPVGRELGGFRCVEEGKNL